MIVCTVRQTWLASILSVIFLNYGNEDEIDDRDLDLEHDDL